MRTGQLLPAIRVGAFLEAAIEEESIVTDLVFTAATVIFFVLAVGYIHGCERLK